MSPAQVWADIVQRVCESPEERVGAVFVDGDQHVHVPLDNVHHTPATAFEVPAAQVVRLLDRADAGPGRFVALYHSHHGRPATLSAEDRALFALPCQFLVVLRVDGGRLTQLLWHPNPLELFGFSL